MSRTTKRTAIHQRIKLVKRLEMQLNDIDNAQRALGYISLKKPIRDGWYKTFRLRDDISRSKYAKIYQEVLNIVCVDVWGRDKKGAAKNWQTYFKRVNRTFQYPGIRRICEQEHASLSVKAKRYFVKRRINRIGNSYFRYYCLLPRYYFQETYQRAYITKRKIGSPALERRKQEILEILEQGTLRKHSLYYSGSSRWYYNPHKRERRKIKVQLCQRNFDISV